MYVYVLFVSLYLSIYLSNFFPFESVTNTKLFVSACQVAIVKLSLAELNSNILLAYVLYVFSTSTIYIVGIHVSGYVESLEKKRT